MRDMCGRFTLTTPPEMLAALFELDDLGDWNDPRYNIAPQTRILTVRKAKKGRSAQSLLWGALNPRDSRPIINARSETVATSPLFAAAFAASRILIPADGFFEWTGRSRDRRGVYFQQPGGAPFAFAGLAMSTPRNAEIEPRAVVLTTEASESVRLVHNRMPLIVDPAHFGAWLDNAADPRPAQEVIRAGGSALWDSYDVGPHVNSPRNDGPECILPKGHRSEAQGSLF